MLLFLSGNDRPTNFIRFAFCKDEKVLKEAALRLEKIKEKYEDAK